MESLDFIIVVIPLASMVAALAWLTYYYARKEEFEKYKWTRAVQKFLETRSKQQALIRRELENVNSQHERGIIEEGTYERLQEVLFMTQEKLRYEASLWLDEKNGAFKKGKENSVEKELLELEKNNSREQEIVQEQEVCEATTPKSETEKPRIKRKTKGKRVKNKKIRRNSEAQMGLLVDDNPLPSSNEKDQLAQS